MMSPPPVTGTMSGLPSRAFAASRRAMRASTCKEKRQHWHSTSVRRFFCVKERPASCTPCSIALRKAGDMPPAVIWHTVAAYDPASPPLLLLMPISKFWHMQNVALVTHMLLLAGSSVPHPCFVCAPCWLGQQVIKRLLLLTPPHAPVSSLASTCSNTRLRVPASGKVDLIN
jgi:hypothetical protein